MIISKKLSLWLALFAATIPTVHAYPFTDIPSDYWAAKSINTMSEQNYIHGYSDHTFRPEKTISREEVASLFEKVIGTTDAVMLSSSFTDITSDRWSAKSIEAVARLNIISGYGDQTYRPDEPMSRQEFAVVADNYIHHLGYKTEDPTVLDENYFSDQKFIAPWAQQAVRELAHLGFIDYNPNTSFNGEKYITRAEAIDILYRLFNTKEAVSLRTTISHRNLEQKALSYVLPLFPSKDAFEQNGLYYWKDQKLVIALKDENKANKVQAAIANSGNHDLQRSVIITQSRFSQYDFESLLSKVAKTYHETEKNGTITKGEPNLDTEGIVLFVDTASEETQKALIKKYGKKVKLQLPSTTIKQTIEKLDNRKQGV